MRAATVLGVAVMCISGGSGLLVAASTGGGGEPDEGVDTGAEISFVSLDRPGPSETPAVVPLQQPNMWEYPALEREQAFEEHRSFLYEGGDFAAEKAAP